MQTATFQTLVKKSSKNKSNHKTTDNILHLQQTIGNQAVYRLIQNSTIQPKLSINYPADSAELEADRTVDKVMRMSDFQVQTKSQEISRQSEEEALLQGKLMIWTIQCFWNLYNSLKVS